MNGWMSIASKPSPRPPGGGDRELLATALAWLHLIGPTLALVWLAFPHRAHATVLLSGIAGGYTLGAILFLGRRRLPAWAHQPLMVGTTAAISVAVAASGDPGSVFSLFYLWATLHAFCFFTRRQAALQTLVVGVGYGAALLLQRADTAWHDDVTRWVVTLATLLTGGWLVRRITDRLRDREQQLRAGLEGSVLGSAAVGPDGRLVRPNHALARFLDRPRRALEGAELSAFAHPDDQAPQRALLAAGLVGDETAFRGEHRYLRPDGGVVWGALNATVIRDERGRPRWLFVQIDDVTERRRAQARQVALSRVSALWLAGDDREALARSTVAEVAGALDGASVALALDAQEGLAEVLAGEGWEEDELRRAVAEGLPGAGVRAAIRTGEGRLGTVAVHATRSGGLTPPDRVFVQAIAGVLSAAHARLTAERRMRHQALHDPLTGLPNRALLLDRLEHALARTSRRPTEVGAIFLDLDHFKVINDSLGHEAGDALLRLVAPRLAGALRESDTLARLGGDEFVVVCEDLDDVGGIVRVAERLLAVFEEPFPLDGDDLHVSASVGVALATPGADARSLLRDADAAMYRAKELGRGRYELFDDKLRQRVVGRLHTETALRTALANGELRLAYQPILDLAQGRIVDAEALLRWRHPQSGDVPPADFVPVAEETGLIVPIGSWVIAEACRQAAGWRAASGSGADVGVSVNLSPRQLAEPELVSHVERQLAATGLPPHALTLEVTESAVLDEGERPLEALRELKALGVRLALDDFGTGYSSLAHLTRLPLDVLKLDRAFIARLAPGARETEVTGAICEMANALMLEVVAEGVETEAHVAMLRELRCERVQGFFFARPMDAESLAQRLSPAPARPAAPVR
jgi:diguanylate cyclase (GGDEF)-like protein/PAS domain S-box-containing protein